MVSLEPTGIPPHGRLIAIGLRHWKRVQLAPILLALRPGRLHFVRGAAQAAALGPGAADALLHWGPTPPADLGALAERSGARLIRLEDGFLRSVGLGSDLIPPRSLVLDAQGLYVDATRDSALERLLRTARFTPDELAEAAALRGFIVANGLSKYNHEPRRPAHWPAAAGRGTVLVPGQVEDDASIRLGCTTVRTNAQLLAAARTARPDAFIVYKPHPDVSSGNRRGALPARDARRWADHVENHLSVVSCIEACDELHTMTSLAGFDALLRDKPVTTHGLPFYAGWGLTTDRATGADATLQRRGRSLSLDELVAGALLRYPLYWDPVLRGFTTAMAVARQLQRERDALAASGALGSLGPGWWRRQRRKAGALWRAWTAPWR
jgi:capsular polysaccharide export protein